MVAMVREHGRLFEMIIDDGRTKASTLLHYISFEIWIVMINTDTQRTIQRSSSWAIN